MLRPISIVLQFILVLFSPLFPQFNHQEICR